MAYEQYRYKWLLLLGVCSLPLLFVAYKLAQRYSPGVTARRAASEMRRDMRGYVSPAMRGAVSGSGGRSQVLAWTGIFFGMLCALSLIAFLVGVAAFRRFRRTVLGERLFPRRGPPDDD